jgi:hypothetical protein
VWPATAVRVGGWEGGGAGELGKESAEGCDGGGGPPSGKHSEAAQIAVGNIRDLVPFLTM